MKIFQTSFFFFFSGNSVKHQLLKYRVEKYVVRCGRGELQYYPIVFLPMPIFGYATYIYLSFKLSDWKPQTLRSVQRRGIANGGDYNEWLILEEGWEHRLIPILSGWLKIELGTSVLQEGPVDATENGKYKLFLPCTHVSIFLPALWRYN